MSDTLGSAFTPFDATGTFEGAEVRSIEIEAGSDEVQIIPTDIEEIEVERLDSKGEPWTGGGQLHTDVHGAALMISVEYKGGLLTPHKAGIIRILWPEHYSGSISVTTKSGQVDVGAAKFGKLTLATQSGQISVGACTVMGPTSIDTRSGQIHVSGMDAQGVTILSGSGSVETEKLVCGSLHVATQSGACELGCFAAMQVSVETSSGAIEVRGSVPHLELSTLSGTQHADMDEVREVDLTSKSGSIYLTIPTSKSVRKIDAATMSGTVHLTLPPDVRPQPQFESTSGSMHYVPADFTPNGEPVYVHVKTLSGSLSVRAAETSV